MNKLIEESIEKLPLLGNVPKILPHQLATIDFIYKKMIYDKENVLLYHKMGSGKTIVSLLISFILTKKNLKITIILPNTNIKLLWISKLSVVKKLMPVDDYNLDIISFITRKSFISQIEFFKNKKNSLVKKFRNTVFIIDEAHNFFGNKGSESILKLNTFFIDNNERPLYILVTGSPITNTMFTLKDLVNIISRRNISETEFMTQNGKKIYNFNLTKQGIVLIKEAFYNKISYFNQEKNEIPPVIYKGDPLIKLPIIPCVMSKEQTKNYIEIKKGTTNEMFLKNLSNASFTTLGKKENILNFEEYIKNKKYYYLTDTLHINKGKFYGTELTTLNNSCKIKYFKKIKLDDSTNNCKTFIYFSNSRIGGRFLKDVLKAQGVQEYGSKQLDNFLCYFCRKKKTCKICKPITYIMITSIYITNLTSKDLENEDKSPSNIINTLLNIFNSSSNDNGEEVMFLFGSKIISESYTLSEVRDIFLLSPPVSLSELMQIVSRALRNFSYKDLTKPVQIYILVAIINDFNISELLKSKLNNKSLYLTKPTEYENDIEIENFINKLISNDDEFSYDLKKILYLEIKSKQTNVIHKLFKNISKKTFDPVDEAIRGLYILEMIRRMSYNYYRFTLNDFLKYIEEKTIPHEEVIKYIDNFIKDGVIVNNNFFNQCYLRKEGNDYLTEPIFIDTLPFIYKIDL